MKDFPYIGHLLFKYFSDNLSCVEGVEKLESHDSVNIFRTVWSSWHVFNILVIVGSKNAVWKHAVETFKIADDRVFSNYLCINFPFLAWYIFSLTGELLFILCEWTIKIILCSMVSVHLGFWSNYAITYLGTWER